MSDSDRPQLLVPDPKKRIVSPQEAARIADRQRKYDDQGRRIRPPGDDMQAYVTREEAMTHVATAVAEATRKCFEEQDDALGDRLEDMEKVITQNVLLVLERTTWRYRFKMWARGWLIELGVVAPVALVKTVDPVEALDPNIAAAASPGGALTWEETMPGDEWDAAVAIARNPIDGLWYMLTRDTETLERAARQLGGENPSFEPGTTAAVLDDVFLARARAIIANRREAPRGGWNG